MQTDDTMSKEYKALAALGIAEPSLLALNFANIIFDRLIGAGKMCDEIHSLLRLAPSERPKLAVQGFRTLDEATAEVAAQPLPLTIAYAATRCIDDARSMLIAAVRDDARHVELVQIELNQRIDALLGLARDALYAQADKAAVDAILEGKAS